jgi:hypothetical protein
MSPLQLQLKIDEIIRDNAAWTQFKASPASAQKILHSWGLKTGSLGAEMCIAGFTQFFSALQTAGEYFAGGIALTVTDASSGNVTPHPGGPHYDHYVVQFGPSTNMIVSGMLSIH